MADHLQQMAGALGVDALRQAEEAVLLDAARDVAHTTQRRYAPLSTFLLGVAVGSAAGEREDALRDAVSRLRDVLPAAADPPER